MERLRLTIGAVAHGGHCVARHDGRVVFVRHTLPGEVVEAVLTDGAATDRFWRADAVEILDPSPDRVPSAWPEAGPGGVGGAELAHVALPVQREWKRAVLEEACERFAGLGLGGTVLAAPGDDERGGLGYRTRVRAVAGADGRASMRAHRSHDFWALRAMPLATEAAETALLGGRFPPGAEIQVVDASGEDGVRVLVDAVPRRGAGPDRRPNAPTHVREVVRVGGSGSDASEYRFRVSAAGFWQVHRAAAAVLVGEVLRRVGDSPRILDLYAGAGLFTLPLAASGREVTSVESDEAAVRDARRNLHDSPTATVVHGDVRETLRSTLGAGDASAFDAIVLDPPRSGAGRATLEAIVALAPATIVYVACDPVALARDIATLRDLGYDLGDVAAWDLFPMTHHVEAVATFTRR